MEQDHRRLINNNLSDLITVTHDVEYITDLLLERNVINKWMKNHILESNDDLFKKIALYNLIQGRGPDAFKNLCKILKDTANIQARNILLYLDKASIANNSNDLLNKSMDNINLGNEINLNHEPYVKIHPERRRMDVDNENIPTGAYPMGSNPKGHTLILNMNKVIGKQDRTGSNVDVENLQKLFDGLGYVVQSNLDLTETEFKNTIENFVINCQNGKTDSIVVFIMSHGEAGNDPARSSDILTADGKNINTDWIIEQFGPDKISRNIPKLFFIQACRGNNSDFGWKSLDAENNRLQNDSTNGISPTRTVDKIKRRYENVFIAYATIPGYNAKRDTVNGSWFVQKLCDVIREHAWKFDLDSLMKMVDMEIKQLNSLIHGFQTVEWTYRGFNKKFYFNPGLYDDNSDSDISKTT